MKKLALLLTAASLLAPIRSQAERAVFKSELENNEVRVLRIRVAPHQRIPMHEVPPHVAIWLTDAQLRITYPDGRNDTRHFKAGQVEWVAMGKHAGENIGNNTIEFVAVEPRHAE